MKKIESPGHLLQLEVSKLKNNIERGSIYKHLVPNITKSRAEGNNSAQSPGRRIKILLIPDPTLYPDSWLDKSRHDVIEST